MSNGREQDEIDAASRMSTLEVVDNKRRDSSCSPTPSDKSDRTHSPNSNNTHASLSVVPLKSYEYSQDRFSLYCVRHDPSPASPPLVCLGYGDGSMDVVSAETCERLRGLAPNVRTNAPIIAIRFSSKTPGTCTAASSNGRIITVDVRAASAAGGVGDAPASKSTASSNTCRSAIVAEEKGNETSCLDYSDDGSVLCTSGSDLAMRMYDPTTFSIVRTYNPPRDSAEAEATRAHHWAKIFTIRFMPAHNNVIVTGGWDNQIKFWDLRTRNGIQRTISGPHISGDGLDISADGRRLLTASWAVSNALQLWEAGEGRLIKTIPFATEKRQTEFLYCARFCAHDVICAGGSGTKSARFFDVNTSQFIDEICVGMPVQTMDTWDAGRRVTTGGAGIRVYMNSIICSNDGK